MNYFDYILNHRKRGKGVQAKESPYRTAAARPKKIETKEEEEVRMAIEKKNKNVLAVLALGFVPSLSALIIGAEWNVLSGPMRTGIIIASVIMSIFTMFAISVKMEWNW